MAEVAFAFRKKRESPCEEERRGLLEGVAKTRTLIAQAYALFNSASDPDLIDSYVFEINALQARYSYLLRRVKALSTPENQGQPELSKGRAACPE